MCLPEYVIVVDTLHDAVSQRALIIAESELITAVKPVGLHPEKGDDGDDRDDVKRFDTCGHGAKLHKKAVASALQASQTCGQ